MPGAARRCSASAARGRRRRHPARRPGRPRPHGCRARRSPSCADEHGVEVLTPGAPARAGVPGPAAPSWRPTAARSSPTARCCRRPRSTMPAHGWVNLHFSLLPAWRGAAPVQHARAGRRRGHRRDHLPLEEGLDTGPVFGVMTEAVRPDDTAGDLLDRLAAAGAGLLVATLDGIEDGTLAAACRSPPRASAWRRRSPSTTPGSTGPRRRCAWTGWSAACTPGPGRLDDVRAASGSSSARCSPRRRRARAGARRARASSGRRSASAPAPRRSGSARCSPPGKRPMAAADWARGARRRGRRRERAR